MALSSLGSWGSWHSPVQPPAYALAANPESNHWMSFSSNKHYFFRNMLEPVPSFCGSHAWCLKCTVHRVASGKRHSEVAEGSGWVLGQRRPGALNGVWCAAPGPLPGLEGSTLHTCLYYPCSPGSALPASCTRHLPLKKTGLLSRVPFSRHWSM